MPCHVRPRRPARPPRVPTRPRVVCILAMAWLPAACSHFPSAAPTSRDFGAGQPRVAGRAGEAARPDLLLVDLGASTLPPVAAEPRAGLASVFAPSGRRPGLALRPGELVGVSIFESGAVPLFGQSGIAAGNPLAGGLTEGGHATTLPAQGIEPDGGIAIPFAGRVRVGGLTPLQAGERIAAALAGRATNPQVVVALAGPSLDTATVGGDVAHPGLVTLTLRGERVLDAVAAAGGSSHEASECTVQLTRRGRMATARLQQLVDDPSEDLPLEPGDSLFVLYEPRSFVVLGAALKVAQYDFSTRRVTLAEAVARAGGPSDSLADVGNLYLLRTEPAETVAALLQAAATAPGAQAPGAQAPPLTAISPAAAAASVAVAAPAPVAYHLDLRHGAGYFLAQGIQMRDKDVILMTNADSVQLQKIFAVVRNVTGVYFDLHSRFP